MWGGPAVNWQWGWMRWQPVLWSSVSGSASASVRWPQRRDPIRFEIFDSGGNLDEMGELMHITLDGTGDGEFTWDEAGLISINPSAIPGSSLIWEMSIMDEPGNDYIPDWNEGFLRLAFNGEIVTECLHTGSFASWMLPGVGNVGPVQLDAETIDLAIDFGRPVDAKIWADTGVPEPGAAALLLLGILALAVRRTVE
jgi:hypothetical protein